MLEAEGRREAAFRDAEARERSAAAEAKATEVVSIAISHGDVAALNYFIADKYIRAFGELARSPNQKVLMMPIEATAMLGSLAGIAEIARDALDGQGGRRARAARPAVPPTPPLPPRPASEVRRMPSNDLSRGAARSQACLIRALNGVEIANSRLMRRPRIATGRNALGVLR